MAAKRVIPINIGIAKHIFAFQFMQILFMLLWDMIHAFCILVSDTIWPWCFVGKRRLEAAIAESKRLKLGAEFKASHAESIHFAHQTAKLT